MLRPDPRRNRLLLQSGRSHLHHLSEASLLNSGLRIKTGIGSRAREETRLAEARDSTMTEVRTADAVRDSILTEARAQAVDRISNPVTVIRITVDRMAEIVSLVPEMEGLPVPGMEKADIRAAEMTETSRIRTGIRMTEGIRAAAECPAFPRLRLKQNRWKRKDA